jgi:hypothetical protein
MHLVCINKETRSMKRRYQTDRGERVEEEKEEDIPTN